MVNSPALFLRNNPLRTLFLSLLFYVGHSLSNDLILSKSDFRNLMINTVKSVNSQFAGLKVDEHTTLKFVTYDQRLNIYTYVYSSNIMSHLNQSILSAQQKDVMKKYHINKTCTSEFAPLLKPYNFKVSHSFQDKISGKVIYNLTISDADCL
jgi:hypothetical protein